MTKLNTKDLSKEELEELGRENGIELDRRLLKSKMVKQLDEHLASSSKPTKTKSTKARKTFREIYGLPPKSSK